MFTTCSSGSLLTLPEGDYMLSALEREAVQKYIYVWKTRHFVHASTTEVWMIINNRNPLPLISSAFEPLHSAKIFTELEHRNVYHLYHLLRKKEEDEWKTAFNMPSGHYNYVLASQML